MQILLYFPPFVPVLLWLSWLIIRFAKRMIRIADGFSDDFEGFDHGSCLGLGCTEDDLPCEHSLLRPFLVVTETSIITSDVS